MLANESFSRTQFNLESSPVSIIFQWTSELMNRIHGFVNFLSQFMIRHLKFSTKTHLNVNAVLRENEFTKNFDISSKTTIKLYETNQLASNIPNEDFRAEAKIPLLNSYLFGVFDGHVSYLCAQATSQRIFHYIAASVISSKDLHNFYKQFCDHTTVSGKPSLIEIFNNCSVPIDDLTKQMYMESYCNYLIDLLKSKETSLNSISREQAICKVLEESITRFDQDICFSEVLRTDLELSLKSKAISTAMAGCVCTIAYIENKDLFVANVGDSSAILGSYNQETNSWAAKKITKEHNALNADEVQRVLSEHPSEERLTVLRGERLLGQLAPFRAIGDCCFKWNKNLIDKLAVPLYSRNCIPPNYFTPPYLTSRPEVSYHKITDNDKFLIIASDGLWDMLSPTEVVEIVVEHLQVPKSLDDENLILIKPDTNSATYLIRKALCCNRYQEMQSTEEDRLTKLLTLPEEIVRYFRDDISVTVIFFNS